MVEAMTGIASTGIVGGYIGDLVMHGRASNLGEKRNGLYTRPEHSTGVAVVNASTMLQMARSATR
jgi:hypothetical protein